MKWDELEFELIMHTRKGGKKSRLRQCERIRQFLIFCKVEGKVKGPDQIGRKHVWEWYEYTQNSKTKLADSTLRDRYYAVCYLWQLLGRNVPPPFPHYSNKAV